MMATVLRSDPRLRELGRSVDVRSPDQELSARTAARLLFGAVGLSAGQYGLDETQNACAELVGSAEAWRTKFRVLPRLPDGTVPPALMLIAVMARGILPLAGPEALRAALAFWASERDPEVWREMAPD